MRNLLAFLLLLLGPVLWSGSITSFSPTSGPVATTVMITGYGFTGAASVAFNGVPCTTFTVVSDTQVQAQVPLGASTGPITVDAISTDPSTFTVIALAPHITSVAPVFGHEGSVVNIIGQGLSTASQVSFNGTVASFVVVSPTQLRAVVPVGATTGPISVTTPLGVATTGSFKFRVL